MCTGISLSWRDFPEALIEKYALHDRAIVRKEEADREIRFLYRDPRPLLPAWHGSQLKVFTWGGRQRQLPRTGWAKLEDVEAGLWNEWQPEPVEIPASFGLDRGVWYQVRQGLRGLLVCEQFVYVLTEPASHYYHVMTRNDRMPVFLGDRI